MASIAVDLNVSLTPQQIAAAFWAMGSDQQVKFLAELDRLAGWQLCYQMAGLVRDIAECETEDHVHALNAFRTMFAHSAGYAEAATDIRSASARSEIEGMVRDAKRAIPSRSHELSRVGGH
ncbi:MULTISPECIES: hypothetical protein [Xanthomonas]|uniref:Uncharacterized protein n=2 Tax=Xanthomonas TaxID=338 RepID=A0A7Z7NGH8_XANCH|nr:MULTISPECIES: hypothetical protein [Xanthomonas]ATS39284.1 hypothetical protein XcfCFBP6988P_15080 [Xanthomonas citri pv. phaseoli var. fuscans]ATS41909.1 hypothetical protein XcfCFBP6989P_05410 [Xanthomonas citri pv. phaseoli var. fuscans]ATS47287.1 hypothetical protein XcfCFBP6990P_11950 [Xanthomonas citri pv. phaseoli var. fuscans]ATS86334.1 hypothetical protein XcfCFBP6991P_22280 [Xanthomonas citri pv. phaseoli var. fuscans]QWN20928.1 hypothetical protein DGM98_13015 [Xanthomonas citri]